MPDFKKIYFDTNIFINIIERHFEAEIRDQLTLLLIKESRLSPFVTTCELTLAEALVRPLRENDEPLITIFENMLIDRSTIEVGPVDRDVLYYAARLRADYPSLKLPDAIHLSAAFGMNCSHFLTSEARLKETYKLSNIRHGLVKGPLEISIIQPTADIVSTLIETAF